MFVVDYDKREKCCPVCKQERLIFIVTSLKLWPVGDTVRYRCRDCAIAEAEAGGDPIEVIRHCERRHVPPAWANDQRPMPKRPITAQVFAKPARRQPISSASTTKVASEDQAA